MTTRAKIEAKGRLTDGDAPLHIRRKHLTNKLRDTIHCVKTSIANWPEEYQLPDDHAIHELLEVMGIVCDDMENPDDHSQE